MGRDRVTKRTAFRQGTGDKVTGLTPFGGVTDFFSLFNTVKGE